MWFMGTIRKYLRGMVSGLAVLVVLSAYESCQMPVDLPLVEQAVDTVKQNIELRDKMNALELPRELESISEGKYAYETLSAEEQVVYDQMLDAINRHEEEVTLSMLDVSRLEDIYECVKADYGGLFWIENFRYTQYQKNGLTQMLSFSPSYTMTLEERERMQRRIDKRAAVYLDGIEKDASDYDKVLYVYRKLIQKVDYNLNAENNQNIISVFINKETVCQGYANATQYLLNLLDVPCVVVTGRANGGSHAWNLVQLDGEWYYLDTTWGNSTYHDAKQNSVKYVEYDYLNITSEELLQDHQPGVAFPLPECTATKDNFYVHEHRYFSDMGQDSIEALGRIFQRTYEKGRRNISVKFSDQALCVKAKEYFLSDYRIRDYCTGLESVYYNTDTNMNIFTIIFP